MPLLGQLLIQGLHITLRRLDLLPLLSLMQADLMGFIAGQQHARLLLVDDRQLCLHGGVLKRTSIELPDILWTMPLGMPAPSEASSWRTACQSLTDA